MAEGAWRGLEERRRFLGNFLVCFQSRSLFHNFSCAVVWPALPASAGRIGRDELNESESFITVNVLFILLSVLDTALWAKVLANKPDSKL